MAVHDDSPRAGYRLAPAVTTRVRVTRDTRNELES